MRRPSFYSMPEPLIVRRNYSKNHAKNTTTQTHASCLVVFFSPCIFSLRVPLLQGPTGNRRSCCDQGQGLRQATESVLVTHCHHQQRLWKNRSLRQRLCGRHSTRISSGTRCSANYCTSNTTNLLLLLKRDGTSTGKRKSRGATI